MKIYTKTGDRGMTSLLSGERVSKAAQRVDVYGDIDELNSVLGVLGVTLPHDHPELLDEIHRIQSDLMRLCAWLATTPDSASIKNLPEMDKELSTWLERSIDIMDAGLPPLKGFILPGGHASAAWSHGARAICRRAERHVVALMESADAGGRPDTSLIVITYLNRLSDYLFVLARHCNRINRVADTMWES